MISKIKRRIHDILKFFGFKVIKLKRDRANFDRLHKIFLKDLKFPIILDIGANIGQTIYRFKKLENSSIIHSFEPVAKDYQILIKKFKDDK